ncbi:MAG: hypothetical protein ACLSHC_16020 [Bilophila wadsworthia]
MTVTPGPDCGSAANLSSIEPDIHAHMKLLDRRIAEDKSAASLFAVENRR